MGIRSNFMCYSTWWFQLWYADFRFKSEIYNVRVATTAWFRFSFDMPFIRCQILVCVWFWGNLWGLSNTRADNEPICQCLGNRCCVSQLYDIVCIHHTCKNENGTFRLGKPQCNQSSALLWNTIKSTAFSLGRHVHRWPYRRHNQMFNYLSTI